MMRTLWGTVKQGKIELLESADLVEGTQVLVTLIPNDAACFNACLTVAAPLCEIAQVMPVV